ncbi:MAG: putative membrane protein, partial [uncultured Thermoleophilia bacterium]
AGRAARRRGRPGPGRRGLGGRRRPCTGARQRQGRGRGRRRHRRHPAVRAGPGRGARAPDHPPHRGGVAAQQAAVHPAGRAAAEPVRAVAAHAHPHAGRHVPLLRGRGEDLGAGLRAPPRRGGGQGRRGRRPGRPGEEGRRGRRADRLHPVRGDHGHRAQRGRVGGLLVPRDHPAGGRRGHHGARVRRGRADRQDGRRGAEAGGPGLRAGERAGTRAGPGDADRALGPVHRRHRGHALGGRAHPARRPRRPRLLGALRLRPSHRGGRPRCAGSGGRCCRLAGQHRRLGRPGARRRRDRGGRRAPARSWDGAL